MAKAAMPSDTDLNFQDYEYLVICEDDYSFNNRWFVRSNDRIQPRHVNNLYVFVRSNRILQNIHKFRNLCFLKASILEVNQLRQFGRLLLLRHVEINRLFSDVVYDFVSANDPVKLHGVEAIRIDWLDDKLQGNVTFDTLRLERIHLGKKRTENGQTSTISLITALFISRRRHHKPNPILRTLRCPASTLRVRT